VNPKFAGMPRAMTAAYSGRRRTATTSPICSRFERLLLYSCGAFPTPKGLSRHLQKPALVHSAAGTKTLSSAVRLRSTASAASISVVARSTHLSQAGATLWL
jgi:hypothetical protein